MKVKLLYTSTDRQEIGNLTNRKVNLENALESVRKILEDVKEKGDEALIRYAKVFDGVELDKAELKVSGEKLEGLTRKVDEKVLEALKKAAGRIRQFHEKQLEKLNWLVESEGVLIGQVARPLESVGVYVPGGRARYPSSLLMATIPAKVAGVKKVVVCTPPRKGPYKLDPVIAAACLVSGVEEVYLAGGAQAIAAMAYGTETVPKVQKIVGPGNIYVTAAKLLVSMDVMVDLPAGPSEIAVIADKNANPKHVALDLLAQVEHDPNALAVLLTPSEGLALKVKRELEKEKGCKGMGDVYIVVTGDLDEALNLANDIAPEHLELHVNEPDRLLEHVKSAGLVCLGYYSPVALADYCAGTNHILPTAGYAKAYSGLGVQDFVKLIYVVKASKRGLDNLKGVIEVLATVEGLPFHARSVRERFK